MLTEDLGCRKNPTSEVTIAVQSHKRYSRNITWNGQVIYIVLTQYFPLGSPAHAGDYTLKIKNFLTSIAQGIDVRNER